MNEPLQSSTPSTPSTPPPPPVVPPSPVAPIAAGAASSLTGTTIGIVSLVAIVGLGIGGYYFFLAEPKPEEVVRRMMQTAADAKSNHTSTDLAVDFTIPVSDASALKEQLPFLPVAPEGGIMNVSVQLKGDSAHEHLDAGKQRGWKRGEFTLRASGVSMSLAYESRAAEEKSFFLIKELPALDLLGLAHLKGQWIKADWRSLYVQFAQDKSIPYEQAQEEGNKTSAALGGLLKKFTLFKVEEKLPQETIQGMPMYHYRVSFNHDEVRAFLKEAAQVSARSGLSTLPGASSERTQEAVDNLNETLDELMLSFAIRGSGELWIGKRDGNLYKLQFTPELDAYEIEPGKKMQAKVRLTQEFSNYNQPVTVEEPSTAMPVEQLLAPLLQYFGGVSALQ